MSTPTVAVILPAYNEAARIEQTVDTVARYVASHPNIRHIVVADDGSTDQTADIAAAAATRAGLRIEVLTLPHQGKALTVRTAMLDLADRIDVDYLMMLDADDELKIDQLDHVPWSTDPRTIYIGRRVGSIGSAESARQAPARRLMSFAMRLANRILLGIKIPDTQCGFKLFPREVVPGLFGQQRSSGWTFDAELLYIATRVSRMPVVEVPVVWSPRGASRVRTLAAITSAMTMLGTTWNRFRRVYHPVMPASSPTSRAAVVRS